MPGAFDLSTHSGASKKDPFGPMQLSSVQFMERFQNTVFDTSNLNFN